MLQEEGKIALLLFCLYERGVVQTKPGSGRLLIAGIMVSLACGVLIELARRAGVIGAKPIVELLLASGMSWRYSEAGVIRWSWRLALTLSMGGVAFALVWILLFAWGNTHFFDVTDASTLALVIGMTGGVVSAPLYEEKVVRHLILQGATGYVGRWWASLLVSLVFGLVHTGAMLWTFLVSLGLCWCALARQLTSAQRAVIHGVMNAAIMLWYFTEGYGLFR